MAREELVCLICYFVCGLMGLAVVGLGLFTGRQHKYTLYVTY